MPTHLQSVLIIGDDMQGHCFAFNMDDDFRLVEIAPNGDIDSTVEPDISSLLGMSHPLLKLTLVS